MSLYIGIVKTGSNGKRICTLYTYYIYGTYFNIYFACEYLLQAKIEIVQNLELSQKCSGVKNEAEPKLL